MLATETNVGSHAKSQQYLPFTVLKLDYVAVQWLGSFLSQQYLPFTVLKLSSSVKHSPVIAFFVATVLTVYGIETLISLKIMIQSLDKSSQQYLPFTVLKLHIAYVTCFVHMEVATVLTVYGIETYPSPFKDLTKIPVATVLTVYGIETPFVQCRNEVQHLAPSQQYLPFTVLKPHRDACKYNSVYRSQQYLPFTVLKLEHLISMPTSCQSRNSTYRLRY